MTTNHRPTLESKRGRDIAIKDTIQHARSGKGQGSLKLRLDIGGAQVDHTKARRALKELENDRKRHKTDTKETESDEILSADSVHKPATSEVEGAEIPAAESGVASDTPLKSEATKTVASSEIPDVENEESDFSEDPESEDEDDEDAEELMRELEKVREEKAKREKMGSALDKSPLGIENIDKAPKKKSWRASSAFSRSKQNAGLTFTTDTLSSDTHKQFLAKYFQ